MKSIPRIEKPIASLIRLIRVAILCSNWRLSTQSVASTFESDATGEPEAEIVGGHRVSSFLRGVLLAFQPCYALQIDLEAWSVRD